MSDIYDHPLLHLYLFFFCYLTFLTLGVCINTNPNEVKKINKHNKEGF